MLPAGNFLEKVKTKAFLISIIVTPLILIAFSLAPTLLSNEQAEHTKAMGIIDTSTVYIDKMIYEMSQYQIENHQPNYIVINLTDKQLTFDSLKRMADRSVFKGKIDGYILILNARTDSVKIEYRSQKQEISKMKTEFNLHSIKLG